MTLIRVYYTDEKTTHQAGLGPKIDCGQRYSQLVTTPLNTMVNSSLDNGL